MFRREHIVDIENVTEPLRISKETLSAENLLILRNFQYWPNFLFHMKNMCIVFFGWPIDISKCASAIICTTVGFIMIVLLCMGGLGAQTSIPQACTHFL